MRRPLRSTLFPYTTLFRSLIAARRGRAGIVLERIDELGDLGCRNRPAPVPTLAVRNQRFDGVDPLARKPALPSPPVAAHFGLCGGRRGSKLNPINLRHRGIAVVTKLLVRKRAMTADISEGRMRQKLIRPVRADERALGDRQCRSLRPNPAGFPFGLRIPNESVRPLLEDKVGNGRFARRVGRVSAIISKNPNTTTQ